MPLHIPGNSWNFIATNTRGVQPTATGIGTLVTAAGTTHTMGAWTSLITGTQKPVETFGLFLFFTAGNTTNTQRNNLVDIGIDPSGGTNCTPIIQYLNVGYATSHILGGISYFFPIYIPARASICARMQGNVAASTIRIKVAAYGQPSNPDIIQCGSKVTTYGAVPGSSVGTTINVGQAAEGTPPVSLGTVTSDAWWWQVGFSVADASITTAGVYAIDLLAGTATNTTNLKLLVEDAYFQIATTEQICNTLTGNYGAYVAKGQTLYGRGQASMLPDTSPNLIAYGLG